MLHYETVERGSVTILNRLMRMEALRPFTLVGGTALSLRHGHRRSLDLDLFSEEMTDMGMVTSALTDEFGSDFSYQADQQAKWAVFCHIGDLKVDLVRIPYARIAEIEVVDGIRMYADDDIGPMKIEAIMNRGARKDFWDIELLLKKRGIERLMADHRLKYPKNIKLISVPRALLYFSDAENGEDPVCLQGMTWPKVKDSISRMVNSYL